LEYTFYYFNDVENAHLNFGLDETKCSNKIISLTIHSKRILLCYRTLLKWFENHFENVVRKQVCTSSKNHHYRIIEKTLVRSLDESQFTCVLHTIIIQLAYYFKNFKLR